ncbi:cation diffusion facilitator family transporter [Hoeflea sp. TYP-13]|uniref:cation diffusion facilitator family transporter n=1 Tax=Hoeflea sp. TYP-13 TaxID=3230023 RepID=UPI0034C6BBBE
MASHSGHNMARMGAKTRALKISAWLTGIYFLIEMAIGIYTGSIAVISDAFHTFSAVGGVILALVAARIARRPADAARTYGSLRAEIIGALLNGVFLFAMAIVVLVMGYMRLQNPIDLPTTPMLIAAFGGLITEIISLWLLFGGQKGDLNVKGAFWHVVQTFVGSLLIIVTALVIRFTGYLPIDPILGMTFGLVLLYASWGIMAETVNILMEGTPPDIDLMRAVGRLETLPGVVDVHHVHAWTLTSNTHVFSAHLRAASNDVAPAVLKQAHELLRNEFGFYLSTLQVETICLDEDRAMAVDFLNIGSMTKEA